MTDLPLGKLVDAPRRVDPSVLRLIDRAAARERLGIVGSLPFNGEDVWRCYELSWLRPGGLPRIGVLTLRIPCTSPATVESKSLKLYLNGFAHTEFGRAGDVESRVATDLEAIVDAEVSVVITDTPADRAASDFTSFCLDGLSVEVDRYAPDAALLVSSGSMGTDAVHTHLFRSVCPITGQPDWGSVAVSWRGKLLDRASLLRYLVSYRDAAGFHEDVIEGIFVDLRAATDATELTVDGRFLRRGGIDLNPFRSTHRYRAPTFRLWRQ
ncbi:MAG: NADPH-dependent 7-cyano-7-deazaguanine reductase QueF [Gammaproteobacteria bacterium]|nr:NADPH-dependent 7-cyano-7-deazaguanine reductase QueF [Gammaproteobacteria bacterium]